MTHAMWVTHSPTADNGGFGSLQPTSNRRREWKGAYRGVHKAGVHSYGLFSLMVKTFCSGSSQAHCRDSTFCIHEMSKRQKKKWGKERKREKKESKKTKQEGLRASPLPVHASKNRQLSQKVKLSAFGGVMRINELVSVKSRRILFIRSGREWLKERLQDVVTGGFSVANCVDRYVPTQELQLFFEQSGI